LFYIQEDVCVRVCWCHTNIKKHTLKLLHDDIARQIAWVRWEEWYRDNYYIWFIYFVSKVWMDSGFKILLKFLNLLISQKRLYMCIQRLDVSSVDDREKSSG